MKHLPKHLRPKWRYLAVAIETHPDAHLSRGAFQRELWYAAQNLVGDPGSADADLTVVRFDSGDCTGSAVVRARHGHTDAARAALACIDEVNGHETGIRVRGISGTIRACEEKYIGRPRIPSDQRTVAFGDGERTAVERDDLLDVHVGESFVGATQLDFE